MEKLPGDGGDNGVDVLACWEIKRCPASHYMQCGPYNSGRGESCWETEEGCFQCDKDCYNCDVFQIAERQGLVKGDPVPPRFRGAEGR